MSYKDVDMDRVEGIRKVKWDGLWHILYSSGKDTYDRVDKKTAMSVLKKIEQHFEIPTLKS